MRKPKLYVAQMDAERFWESPDAVKFPTVKNHKLDNIVVMMDELSYVFSESKDVVLTVIQMNPSHLQYLKSIGILFENIYIYDDVRTAEQNHFSYSLEKIKSMGVGKNMILSTYAIGDDFKKMASSMGWEYETPDLESVIKVNSKKYSTELAKKLGFCKYSHIVTNAKEFQRVIVETFSQYGSVMIKTEFGVSGKGNYKIENLNIIKRMIREVEKQENKGKKICAIIEPCFQVKMDFSTQLFVEQSGGITILSTQIVLNNQFKYGGSVSADSEMCNHLVDMGYYNVLKQAAADLYQDGYYGDICFDSMFLSNDELVPIVEINARKSMSLIKYYLDQRFNLDANKQSIFFYIDVRISCLYRFEDVLQQMKHAGILYTLENKEGLIPLSANTLFINSMLYQEDRNRGRIYFYGIANDDIGYLVNNIQRIMSKFEEG